MTGRVISWKGVGYMAGFPYKAVLEVQGAFRIDNHAARSVSYLKGEAFQKEPSGEYYTADEIRAKLPR